MYGWRGKFGFINPSICDTVLLEFYRLLPEGVLVTPVDLQIQNLVDSEFEQAMGKIEEGVKVLDYEEVDMMIVGGTPPITKLGFDADKKIINRIQKLIGKPVSTTPTAEVDAMRSLGLKRIALVSPYVEALNQHLKSYLEYCGFEVVVIKGLGIVKNVDLTKQNFDTAYMVAKEAYREANGLVDGIFLTCPRWPTVRSITPLEKDLGVPVVTTAQALVWKALNTLGIHEVQPEAGSLFAQFSLT